MDTFTEILKSLPLTALKVNAGGTAFYDITGRGVVLSATPTLTTPINAGATRAAHIGGAGVTFPSGVFIRGKEKRSFSLEATVLPLDVLTDSQSILTHVSAFDGLSFVGGSIRFTVEFNTTGSVYVEYKIPDNFQAMNLIGTYQPGAIKLFVNGQSVGTTEVSDAQIKDGFKTRANNNLYIGTTAGGKLSLMDAFAIYSRALSDAEAYMHYRGSIRVIESDVATSSLAPVEFNGTGRNIYSIKKWSESDFYEGTHADTTVQTNLVPQIDFVTQLSKAGVWIGNFEVPPSDQLPKIYGIKLDWEGFGSFTVATSINGGTSWVTAVNHVQVASTWDIVPTGTPFLVRVTFAGGISADTSYVSEIKMTTYTDQFNRSTDSGRTMTLVSGTTTSDTKTEPIVHRRYNGITTFLSSANIAADTDPDDPKSIVAFETVYSVDNPTSPYIFDARPGGSTHFLWSSGSNLLAFPAGGVLYVNGVNTATGVYTMRANVPVHLMYVFPAGFNTPISLANNLNRSYDFIKLHTVTPTAADALRIYSAYIGYPTSRLATDSNPATESGTAYKTFASDWSMTSAG